MKNSNPTIKLPPKHFFSCFLSRFIFLGLLVLFLVSCDDSDSDMTPQDSVVYIESNNPSENQNAVLAYRVLNNGDLEALPGSPFLIGGTGLANPMQTLGPNDLDVPMMIHNDILYAVNSGSHTIAAMNIATDGALTPIPGSPFPSGGENPVSLAIKNNKLYVVNKSQDPVHGNATSPNYKVFDINADGAITMLLDEVTTTVGSSPTFAYIPQNTNLMFGSDFLGFMTMPAVGTLRSFQLKNGMLDAEVGMPQALPVMGGALGLAKHPKENTLYVGFPVTAEIGIYSFTDSGVLTFKNKVAAGKAACWLRTNENGTRLYALNSAEATVSIYDIGDGENPSEVQRFTLKNPGPIFTTPEGMMPVSSQPFHIELFDESHAYIISQRANPSDSYKEGNLLHILKIDSDGKLIEENEPLALPVPFTARPQGIVFLKK